MMQFAVIAVGGALGSILRYSLQKMFQADFPFGTLMVNIIGCFLIGWLWAASLKGMNEQLRLFLMTGFCGGFTTFSAFSLEAIQLATAGKWFYSGLYITLSVTSGLAATFLGYKIFS